MSSGLVGGSDGVSGGGGGGGGLGDCGMDELGLAGEGFDLLESGSGGCKGSGMPVSVKEMVRDLVAGLPCSRS